MVGASSQAGEVRSGSQLERLIQFAIDIGAVTIAEHARREVQRIESARLYVDVIGAPALARVAMNNQVLRHATTITVGTVEALRQHHRRVDAVIVERALVGEVAQHWPWKGAHVLSVDPGRGQEIVEAVAEVEDLALDLDAGSIADAELQCIRLTRLLLHQQLLECQRALRTRRCSRSRCRRLSVARQLTEGVLTARAPDRDIERTELAAWLRTERRKFLMATKVDALATLQERMAELEVPASRFQRVAFQVADDLVGRLLATFVGQITVEVQRRMWSENHQLLSDLATSLGDLMEELPLHLLRPLQAPPVPMLSARALFARPPDQTAHEYLVRRLESDSEIAIQRLAGGHDRSRMLFERRCCEILDATLEAVRAADVLAREPVGFDAGGAPTRLENWLSTFAALD